MSLLRSVVRWLGVVALEPPPCCPGDAGRATEQRRIQELRSLSTRVPQVLGSGPGFLVLSDLGETLATRLRRSDSVEWGRLLGRTATEIARVHALGGYLGQPVARNIVVDPGDDRIGFLDFEEDPGEVMSLQHAQVRDWLMFSTGVARHGPFDEVRMSEILAPLLRRSPPEVRHLLAESVERLAFLRTWSRWFGKRASGLGKAVGVLQRAVQSVPAI